MSIVALKNAVVTLIQKAKGSGGTSELGGSESTPLLRGSNSNSSRHDNLSSSSSDIIYGRNSAQDLENSPMSVGKDNRNGDSSSDNEKANLGFFQSVDPRVISDLIIGLSDGLTVPFALTAGLSSLGDAKLVITGGFAELISGAISMGLGGYLGAKSESDYYHAEVKKEKRKFYDNSNLINREIEDILLEINPNFSDETIVSFIKDLQRTPELMVDFIIRYGRGLDEPAENRELISAVTIGGGYLLGGLVPLVPYFFVSDVGTGLIYSIIVMVVTLFWFGYVKTKLSMGSGSSTSKKVTEGVEMVVVGGVAAGAAWFFVKLLG
ncbi:CPA_1a_G0037440.mRNA.1.CDS.1 [Saccharomyces cerevisiae]|nr:CPA_1a_G0037440.mRNA.1.CDS.1 [Saccharomyces cerevisiae]CAI4627835.1 AMP_1a_G0037290.mRNA.1.CDS.1 [Saccharomyces cerevisiae]CAI4638428.1 BBM_1a_G0036780.mRNA.1.CDS.1 [Saccharomyces cerevisiae]CAI6809576.1 AMP_1a_G0037290.mRNA.1.CDS.1 [Saccharomyces cerevisiae]CAI7235422.1 BBM_1a_G0036780.mRNA.1.CDS.1 [Saccharomyces cerevisiae]